MISGLNSKTAFHTVGQKMVQNKMMNDQTKLVKEGPLLKGGYFIDIGASSVKTVADRHRHAAYHNKH